MQDKPKDLPDNIMNEFFNKNMLKTLAYHTLRVDIADNNDKAEMIKYLLGYKFDELGTGTNRIAFLHDGLVAKIALDRRGIVDNYTEFKRSLDLPNILIKVYESNYFINIEQYGALLSQPQFIINEVQIKKVLSELSKFYLFDDIGFTLKNSMNWGYVENDITGESELRIIDYGYLYSLVGQDRNELFRCPKCNGLLEWSSDYTYFRCKNPNCNYRTSPSNIRDRMKLDYEDLENQMVSSFNHLKTPNLKKIEKELSSINI
jgi:uncharacterized C2H2 Zn-finger protein